MTYEAKSYDQLLGMAGFSDQLLKNHFTLYKGYIDNTNKLVQELSDLLKEGRSGSAHYKELKRRFVWEYNGIRLHEFYFEGMSKAPEAIDEDSPLARQMGRDFGSVQDWEKSFRAVGAMRGVGWALLCFDPEAESLYNVWINEHNVNVPFRAAPLLLMDVWEHAFMLDYGTKRDGYIDAFMKAVDWKAVNARFKAAARELSASRK